MIVTNKPCNCSAAGDLFLGIHKTALRLVGLCRHDRDRADDVGRKHRSLGSGGEGNAAAARCRGRGWVSGKLLSTQLRSLTIKAAPDENAADVAEMAHD
jgi:hypothetical protein